MLATPFWTELANLDKELNVPLEIQKAFEESLAAEGFHLYEEKKSAAVTTLSNNSHLERTVDTTISRKRARDKTDDELTPPSKKPCVIKYRGVELPQ